MAAKKNEETHKKPTAAENAGRVKKSGKSQDLPLVAGVVLIALVAAFMLFGANWGQPAVPPVKSEGNATVQTHPAADALFGALVKVSDFPKTYQLVFSGEVRNTPITVQIYSYEDGRAASIETPYNTRSIFWKGNETVMCEQEGEAREICANITPGSSTEQYMLGIGTMFIDNSAGATDLERDRKLVGWGAMKFAGAPSEIEIGGRTCTNLAYSLDYNALTAAQLKEVGISTQFDKFSAEECLDTEYGIPLWVNVTYDIGGQTGSLERTVLRLSAPIGENITMPTGLASEGQLLSEISKTEADWIVLGLCGALNGTDADKCYRDGAADSQNPKYCESINNATLGEQCYAIVAVMSYTPDLCSKTGALTDECYLQVAINGESEKPCALITNSTIQEACVNATKKQ